MSRLTNDDLDELLKLRVIVYDVRPGGCDERDRVNHPRTPHFEIAVNEAHGYGVKKRLKTFLCRHCPASGNRIAHRSGNDERHIRLMSEWLE